MREVGQITCFAPVNTSPPTGKFITVTNAYDDNPGDWVYFGRAELGQILLSDDWYGREEAIRFKPSTITLKYGPTYVNIPLLMGWDARRRERTRKRLSQMHSLYHRRRK